MEPDHFEKLLAAMKHREMMDDIFYCFVIAVQVAAASLLTWVAWRKMKRDRDNDSQG